MTLESVEQASASFTTEKVERIVLTSTEAADGLERLGVIVVGMDNPEIKSMNPIETDRWASAYSYFCSTAKIRYSMAGSPKTHDRPPRRRQFLF